MCAPRSRKTRRNVNVFEYRGWRTLCVRSGSPMRSRIAVATFLASTSPAVSIAGEPPPSDPTAITTRIDPVVARRGVAWDPTWTKFQPIEVALTGGALLGTAAIIIFGSEGKPNWHGPILFDDPVRDAFRGGSAGTRRAAQLVGDLFYYNGLAYPYLVDTVAVTWLGHRAPEVAAQMALMNTEAFAMSGFLSFLSNATIRRERPYARECAADRPDPGFPDCKKLGQSESFYSGHTAIAFTGAALTCMHHANLPLYGESGTGGLLACIGMMAGATTTGVLRLVADKHYVSDVLAGAAIGLAAGFLVPYLHYHSSARPQADTSATAGSALRFSSPLPASPHAAVQWMPLLSPTSAGIGAMGSF